MKKIFLLLTLITVGTLSVFSNPVTENPKYEKLWKKVDSLSKKGLTKSALDVVLVIYKISKQEKNAPEFVKAIIHKMKFESETDEKFHVTAIRELKIECAQNSFPLKQVLHSILAQVYWSYYENNRFKFENRTTTVNFNQDDIETWDLKKITDEVILNYTLSLGNAEGTGKISLNIYDIVLHTGENSKKFRPTLYDFLAHRAVDFFISEEPDLIKPAYKFELDNENYFLPNEKFINEKFMTKDTSSMKYHAVLIFQNLLRFHLKDADPVALIDADIKRLKFVRSHSVMKNKDSLYLNSLESLGKQFLKNPSSADIFYETADLYRGKGELYDPLKSEDNKWNFKKAYEICETAIKNYPGSDGAAKCKYLLAVILTKNLELTTDDIVPPGKPSLAYVSYKNVSEMFFRIIKTEPRDYKRISRKTGGIEIVEKYTKEKAFKEWSVKLPDDKDFQTHSVETKIPELPAGFYIVLAGTDKNFNTKNNSVGISNIWVSDISFISRKDIDGGNEFYILDRTAGTPIKSVQAEIYYQSFNYQTYEYEYEKGEIYNSNDEGYLDIPPSDNNKNFYIEFSKGNDKLYSDYNFYQYRNNYKSDSITRISTILYTDRSIYRPGQSVHYKGIVLETKGEKVIIKTNHKTKVTFYDVNYQKISETDLVTNEYGTFGGNFTAPLSALTGLMHIANENGLVYFSVEEYKRPKFEVGFQKVKGSYKLGETIIVKGNAKAYAGSNVDNALVKFRVVRTTYFPYYWNYNYDYIPYDSDEMEIANGTTNTNENGEFTINFMAIPDLSIDKKRNPQFDFKVYADVTDINGETHSSEANISVSYKSLIAKVEIPGMIDKSDKAKKEFKITTTNLNGEPEPSKGNVSIYKLRQPDRILRERKWNRPDKFIMTKDEFYTNFPNDVYDDENNISKWEKGNKVLSFDFDTKQDSLLKPENIDAYEQGQYVIELKTKDKYGEDVEFTGNFIIYSSAEKSVTVNKTDWFTAIKNSGEPGEKAVFIVGTKEKNANVLFETESKRKIIKKEWLNLSEEQKLIEVPITEEYRGDFFVHFTFVKNNRVYKHDEKISVPHTNKELEITYETFRNKLLPGQKEEWRLKIKGKNGEKYAAEMLASMYDASLDAFKPHNWNFNIYPSYYSFFSWRGENSFGTEKSVFYNEKWNVYPSFTERKYDNLNWFGFYLGGRHYYSYDASTGGKGETEDYVKSARPQAAAAKEMTEETVIEESKSIKNKPSDKKNIIAENAVDLSNVIVRKNFNETAFFYPFLQTNENGDVIISFTAPEALTKWKFMGFAHTKDLKYGFTKKEIITQKELMLMPNAPRFFREGDKIIFSAKISNISANDLIGSVNLILFDATTMKPIDSLFKNINITKSFEAKKGQSTALNWELTIPQGIDAVTYRIVAKAGNFSDGEEMTIPVLPNRMLVTESLPLPVRGNQTKDFSFTNLINSKSSATLVNHKLTLEYTSNPAWYAVQALPYLMEYPYECAEQVFSRYYANTIASAIANSNPKIMAVFDNWKKFTPDAFLSNLQKNQELKSVILEETPWVLDAIDENKSKQNIALLFDLNKMSDELDRAMNKLQQMQTTGGAWPWFAGMPDDRYITQHIVAGLGHLKRLGIKDISENKNISLMTKKAIEYLDNCIKNDYDNILKYTIKEDLNKNHLSSIQIQYFYARSYFIYDYEIVKKNKDAFDYFKNQAKKYWLDNDKYLQGMLALAFNRMNDKNFANDILKSLKEKLIYSEEMGAYWKDITAGYYWNQAPIETQALMIEAFDEIANDAKTVDELKIWLLKQKQTQNWKTTKATVEACYALLLKGTDFLADDVLVKINLGNVEVDPKKIDDVKVEAGTGYFKTSWSGNNVNTEMGKIKISKTTEGIAWGALYWQYFEQLDKIKKQSTNLQIVKKLFIERNTPAGPVIEPVSETNKLKIGDKIIVRIEIRTDRNMEYVHLKDMRASGTEPINVLSQYKYQGGLGYYESTKDASANFFISYLPKGTYVFEYPLKITHNGDFSNGITTIQCMYAPEFTSHSEGIRIKVE